MIRTLAPALFALATLLGLTTTLGPCTDARADGRAVERRTFRFEEQSTASGAHSSHAGRGPLGLEARLDRGLVLADGERELFLCLYLEAELEERDGPRPGVDLALVVDRSGSMASDGRLEHAVAASEQLVARLGPDDDLALVAYDDEVRTLVPVGPVTERARYHAALRALVSGSTTNLHGGLVRGAEELRRSRGGERLRRVLLLSDGLANAGELTELEDLGDVAADLRRRGVRVSTLGVGLDYDEALMQELASRSGGNYHYARHAEDVAGFLNAELDELAATVAKDATVTLRLADGVRVEEVYGHRFEQGFYERAGQVDGRAARIKLEDLRAGERRRVLVRLRVAAGPDGRSGSHGGGPGVTSPVLRADLRYALADTGSARAIESAWSTVGRTRDVDAARASRDLEVWSKVEVVRNAEALLAAMELRGEGRWQDAMVLLQERVDASRRSNATGPASDEVERLTRRLETVHDELAATAHDRDAGRDLGKRSHLSGLGYL